MEHVIKNMEPCCRQKRCCYTEAWLLLVFTDVSEVEKEKQFPQVVTGHINGRHWPLWLCWTGSAVSGEWGSAHFRAALPRSPGHAHEDRDDVARRFQPGLQTESRAQRARVGGASGTKRWEKRRTRQWNQVSQEQPGPQGRGRFPLHLTVSLLRAMSTVRFFPGPKNICLFLTYQTLLCHPILIHHLQVETSESQVWHLNWKTTLKSQNMKDPEFQVKEEDKVLQVTFV